MDSDEGKLFVGGLGWDIKEDKLRSYFSHYGEVTHAIIMRDRVTGLSRGFAFVVFSDPSVIDIILQQKHTIDGRPVEAKRALPRTQQQSLRSRVPHANGDTKLEGNIRTRKIFVGGLPSSLTEEEFCQYFQNYGNVTDKVIMFDPNTGRPRGFGFITFDSEDAADKVLHKNFHELKNKLVEVKRALPKEANPAGNGRGGGHPGYGSSDSIRVPQPAFCGYTPYNSYGALNYGYGYDPYTWYGGAAGVYMNPSLASISYASSFPGVTRNQWSSQNIGYGDFYNLNASYGASSSLGASSTRGVVMTSTNTPPAQPPPHPSDNDLIGGSSRSSTPAVGGAPSRKSPMMDQSVQVSNQQNRMKAQQNQHHDGRYNQGFNRGGNNYRDQHRGDNRDFRDNRDRDYRDNRDRGDYRDYRDRNNYSGGGQMLQRMQNANRGWVQRGGGVRQWGNGRGGRPQLFNRPMSGPLNPNQKPKNKLKFDKEYDFEQANSQFEELRSQLSKIKIEDGEAAAAARVNGETDKKDDSGNETGIGEGETESEDADAVFYNKAKSFFDNISCEAIERSKGRLQRIDWRQERKLNSETFGVSMARRGNFRGGRGSYYGGGGYNNNYNRGGGYHHNRQQNYNRQQSNSNRGSSVTSDTNRTEQKRPEATSAPPPTPTTANTTTASD